MDDLQKRFCFAIAFKNTVRDEVCVWVFEDKEAYDKGHKSLSDMPHISILSDGLGIKKSAEDFK